MKRKMKPILYIMILLVCSTTYAAEPEKKDHISGFNGYDWGTEQSVIEDEVITPEMELGDLYDYNYSEWYSVDLLELSDGSVAGYEAELEYAFLDDKLIGGGYDISLREYNDLSRSFFEKYSEKEAHSDIYDKYTAIYGEPIRLGYKKDKLHSALWGDTDKNFIVIVFTDHIYIYYGMPEDDWIDYASEFINYDILDQLAIPGNYDGI